VRAKNFNPRRTLKHTLHFWKFSE